MSRHSPLPPVLRSLQHIRDTTPGFIQPATLPITSEGTTYAMVQELSWIDLDHFAVGRWDGSMSIFQFNASPMQGPVISKAVNTPSSEGVQMITWIAPGVFASSNDGQSVLVWKTASGNWTDLALLQNLGYNSAWGVANSGAAYTTPDNTTTYLIFGHESGFITIWKANPDGTDISLMTSVDLRAAKPVNPWGLHNIRGISTIYWTNQYGYIITGSEDGNLCVVRVPDGAIMSTTVFNPAAQRGINSITTAGQNLLVANCAVGPADKNLWYYWIDSNTWSVTLRDSAILRVNPGLPQVFNFDVIWGYYSGGLCWFATTEEGVLWMGMVINNSSLSIIGNQAVTGALGSAIAMALNGNLALAAYDLYEFNTTPGNLNTAGTNPEKFLI